MGIETKYTLVGNDSLGRTWKSNGNNWACQQCGLEAPLDRPWSEHACLSSGKTHGATEESWNSVRRERDALKLELASESRRVESWMADAKRAEARVSSLNRDVVDYKKSCDEWKRRAEAAEGMLADIPRMNAEQAMADIAKMRGMMADPLIDWTNRANAAKTPAERLEVVNEGLKAGHINMRLARRLLDVALSDERGLVAPSGPSGWQARCSCGWALTCANRTEADEYREKHRAQMHDGESTASLRWLVPPGDVPGRDAETVPAMLDGSYVILRRVVRSLQELGPGIAAKSYEPDNSIAHLDEDLLCEDA